MVDSSEHVLSPLQRQLPTQNMTTTTDEHPSLQGHSNRGLSNQVVAHLRLRPLGHRDWQSLYLWYANSLFTVNSAFQEEIKAQL